MASAARAYASQAAPRRSPAVSVVPGRRSQSGLSPVILFAARVFIAALAVFAIVACVRIGLASATVTTSLETERINNQVEAVRSGSTQLEVTESSLSNPATVKSTASKQYGMAAPLEVETISLDPDVVTYNEEGQLTLATSLSTNGKG